MSESPTARNSRALGDVAEVVLGKTPRGLDPRDRGSVPFYKVGDMNASEGRWMAESRTYLDDSLIDEHRLRVLRRGAVIFPKVGGAIATDKKRLVARPAAVDTNTMAVVADPSVLSDDYLYYWFESFPLSSIAYGSPLPQINRNGVSALRIPVPSLDQQQRIVEAIEEQFSRLDAGVESLYRAQRNLAHFRASVLRAAVEGRLVDHADKRSSRPDLVASLIEQRQVLHEVENPGMRLFAPETVEALGPTPEHWSVMPLFGVAETRLGKMLSKKSTTGTRPRPYLRNLNVQWHRFDLSDVAEMDIHEDEADRYRLRRGDLLVCEGGEVGRCAVWEGAESEMYYQKALHRVRPIPGVSSYYLALVLEYLTSNKLIGSFVTGSTIDHLPQEDLRRLPIPVPPFEEQSRILAEVDRLTSIAKAVAEAANVGLQRGAVLRNAVLRDAFNGSLSARSPVT